MIELYIKNPDHSFENSFDFISFFIIQHVLSLQGKPNERTILQAVVGHPILSPCESLIRHAMATKRLLANFEPQALPEQLKLFFIQSEEPQALRPIFYYLNKKYREIFTHDFLLELKVIVQKKQLQQQISGWMGEDNLKQTLQAHDSHKNLQPEVSWQRFQQTMALAVVDRILHLQDLSLSVLNTIQSFNLDEEYKNAIEACFHTQQVLLTPPSLERDTKLIEIFETISSPECLQSIVNPLRRQTDLPQEALQKLVQVSFKKILLKNSYMHLNIWELPSVDEKTLQMATLDPQVDRYDFMERLAFLTIKQTFASTQSSQSSVPGTLRTQILSIKEALVLDPALAEEELLKVAKEIKKPDLFLQIAHYLFTLHEEEKHRCLIQFLNKYFPIEDVTTTKKAHFSKENREWTLQEGSNKTTENSSFNPLPQEFWALLKTHQLDLAANLLEKQGGIWGKMATLLANREFVGIYKLIKANFPLGDWENMGVRLLLLLDRPQLASKFFTPSLEIWKLLNIHEIIQSVKYLEKRGKEKRQETTRGSICPFVAPLVDRREFKEIYDSTKKHGYFKAWQEIAKELLVFLGKPDLASKISQAHNFERYSEEKAEKFAQIIQYVLVSETIHKIDKISILKNIIQCMSSWEYDPWKNHLTLLMMRDFEQLALDLATSIQQPSYRQSLYNTLATTNNFLFAWKLIEQEISRDRFEQQVEDFLIKCNDPNLIIQQLMNIYHYSSGDTLSARFCERVLCRITKIWAQQAPEQPEKIKQALRVFRYALQNNASDPVKTSVCMEWARTLSKENYAQSPFFEACLKLANSIQNEDCKQELCNFCLSENRTFLLKTFLEQEESDHNKKHVCQRLFEEGKIDDAFAIFSTIKNLFYYETIITYFIKTLLTWNTEEKKALYDEGLQKIVTTLKNLPRTPQADLIKYRMCLHWIHKNTCQAATEEIMSTIKIPEYSTKLQEVLSLNQSHK
jgi:hypothetical protein